MQFQCSVGGDPAPQVLWTKDDGKMPVGRADILEEDKSLIIKNVMLSDQGLYICQAHNSVGQITAKAHLVVHCKPFKQVAKINNCNFESKWSFAKV